MTIEDTPEYTMINRPFHWGLNTQWFQGQLNAAKPPFRGNTVIPTMGPLIALENSSTWNPDF